MENNGGPAPEAPPGPRQAPPPPDDPHAAPPPPMPPRHSNPQEQLLNVRNRLFNQMFRRLALQYGAHVPYKYRRLIEVNLFIKACVVFFVLVYFHFTVFNQPIPCLDTIVDSWPRDGVLRIEILHRVPVGYSLPDSYRKQYHDYRPVKPPSTPPSYESQRGVSTSLPSLVYDEIYESNASLLNPPVAATPAFNRSYDATNGGATDKEDTVKDFLVVEELDVNNGGEDEEGEGVEEEESFGQQLFKELIWDVKSAYDENYIIEYSLNYGLLYLKPDIREKFNITVMLKIIDLENDKCLGDNFNRFLLEVLGYNDVILSSIKSIVEKENFKGYLVNVITGEQYRFVSVWLSRLRYIPAFMFMIVFTLVVSMLLRYSHHQIFIFILGLIQNFEMNSRFNFPIAPFITIVLALVGIEEIMTDFFNDTTTAFYIILIVWIADQYDSICCNNAVSKKYWLRFFFLYHYVFYAYHYRFNGHHSHLALFSSWLFILHSMMYFFHHYELPSLENMEAATRLLIDNRVDQIAQIRLVYHGHVGVNELPAESAPDGVVRLSTPLVRVRRARHPHPHHPYSPSRIFLDPQNITLCQLPVDLVPEPPLSAYEGDDAPSTGGATGTTPRYYEIPPRDVTPDSVVVRGGGGSSDSLGDNHGGKIGVAKLSRPTDNHHQQ